MRTVPAVPSTRKLGLGYMAALALSIASIFAVITISRMSYDKDVGVVQAATPTVSFHVGSESEGVLRTPIKQLFAARDAKFWGVMSVETEGPRVSFTTQEVADFHEQYPHVPVSSNMIAHAKQVTTDGTGVRIFVSNDDNAIGEGAPNIPWKYVLVIEGPQLLEIMTRQQENAEPIGTSFALPLSIRQRLGIDRVRVAIPGLDIVPGTIDVFQRAYELQIDDAEQRFAGTVFCVEHPGLDF